MTGDSRYFDLSKASTASGLGWMTECLLASRLKAGLPSNEPTFDEDVNVYLAHLLVSMIHPASRERWDRYVSLRDTDVFTMATAIEGPYEKALIYRTNADYLLVVLSLFAQYVERRQAEASAVARSRQLYEGHGKAYYAFAAELTKQRYRGLNGVSEVLAKLADSFEKYELILSYVRDDYFNWLRRFPEDEFQAFLIDVEQRRQSLRLPELRDELLDAYSNYRKNPSPADRERLERLAEELRRLDPNHPLSRLTDAL